MNDNAEHVRVLKTMRSENYDWPVHSDKETSEIAALTAAIAALSAPKAEAVEGGEVPHWALPAVENALNLLDHHGYMHTDLAAVRDWLKEST